jgi:hypothetical protein
MALLSDMEEDGDDEEQQQTFNRISGILSSLIQEANDAINGIEQERVHLTKSISTSSKRSSKTPRLFTSSTIITNHNNDTSKIPRPRRSRTLNNSSSSSSSSSSSGHHRNVSSCSNSSSTSTNTASALFSPISTSTSATLSRSPSPTLGNFKKQLFRHHNTLRPRSCPIIAPPRRSMTPRTKRTSLVSDPIVESFKRLDTSMALVDSLSRDLATPKSIQDTTSLIDSRLTFLILVPLLHIPHSLITMIFDFCTASNSTNNNVHLRNTPSFSLSSMIFWACVFAVTNLMVDHVAVTPKTKKHFVSKVRRLSLPGSYNNNMTEKKKKPLTTTNTAVVPVKRTWIPATIQKQYQFRLGQEIPSPQIRRNSI